MMTTILHSINQLLESSTFISLSSESCFICFTTHPNTKHEVSPLKEFTKCFSTIINWLLSILRSARTMYANSQ